MQRGFITADIESAPEAPEAVDNNTNKATKEKQTNSKVSGKKASNILNQIIQFDLEDSPTKQLRNDQGKIQINN